jgi:hypothetical protein
MEVAFREVMLADLFKLFFVAKMRANLVSFYGFSHILSLVWIIESVYIL